MQSLYMGADSRDSSIFQKNDKTPKKTPSFSKSNAAGQKAGVSTRVILGSRQAKLTSAVGRASKVAVKEERPRSGPDLSLKTDASLFRQYAPHLFMLLHYLYEDIKLDRFRFPTQGETLAKLLINWIMTVCSTASDFLLF
jgi:hypothetical protein